MDKGWTAWALRDDAPLDLRYEYYDNVVRVWRGTKIEWLSLDDFLQRYMEEVEHTP